MSAAGTHEHLPGLSVGTTVRLIVGWCSVAVAVLDLGVELDRPPAPYLVFHGMLLVGGSVLLALGHLVPRAGLLDLAVGAVVAMAGLLVGALWLAVPFAAGQTRAHLVGDALFWAYAGLVALVVTSRLRRVPRHGG